MTTFIDTNVLFAVLDDTEPHHRWCVKQLTDRKTKGPVLITDIVYAEFSVGMHDMDDVDAAIARLAIERYPGKDEVLFRAGKAFLAYRRRKGAIKGTILPDFLVGAAAEIEGKPLVTADPRDIEGYFPNVEVIKPLLKKKAGSGS